MHKFFNYNSSVNYPDKNGFVLIKSINNAILLLQSKILASSSKPSYITETIPFIN